MNDVLALEVLGIHSQATMLGSEEACAPTASRNRTMDGSVPKPQTTRQVLLAREVIPLLDQCSERRGWAV